MCVYNTKNKVNALKRKYKNTRYFVGYKVVRKSSLGLRTTIKSSPIMAGYKYATTTKKGGELLPENYSYTSSGARGIHIYYTKEKAESTKSKSWYNPEISRRERVIRVLCDIKDLLAADYEQAAFRKVLIVKEWLDEDTK